MYLSACALLSVSILVSLCVNQCVYQWLQGMRISGRGCSSMNIGVCVCKSMSMCVRVSLSVFISI